MARRKNDLAGKLSDSGDTRPGWRDTITMGQTTGQQPARRPSFLPVEPEPEPANKIVRKTYLLYVGMIEEIEQLADRERVGKNELVRFLLGAALDQVYNKTLTIPTQPGRRRIEP